MHEPALNIKSPGLAALAFVTYILIEINANLQISKEVDRLQPFLLCLKKMKR